MVKSLQCGRPEFDPWVGKIPWRRKWQPTPVFLAWKIPWMEEPGGLSSMGSQESDPSLSLLVISLELSPKAFSFLIFISLCSCYSERSFGSFSFPARLHSRFNSSMELSLRIEIESPLLSPHSTQTQLIPFAPNSTLLQSELFYSLLNEDEVKEGTVKNLQPNNIH